MGTDFPQLMAWGARVGPVAGVAVRGVGRVLMVGYVAVYGFRISLPAADPS